MVAKTESTSTKVGSGFFSRKNSNKQALIMIFGDGGHGKTAFALEFAAHPVATINYDGRDDPVIEKARSKGRIILPGRLHVPARGSSAEEVMKQAQTVMNTFEDNFFWAVEENRKGNIRTILIDTGTEHSRVLKLAFDGVTQQTKKGGFGKDKDFIYNRWGELFAEARKSSVNLIVAARASEIWVEDEKGNQKATGRYKYKCAAIVNDLVDLSMHIRLKKGAPGRFKKEFELEVTKSGPNLAELGQIYTQKEWGDMGPFVWSCLMQYEGSSPEDWGFSV